jgi:acetyl esterase/lipase
MYHWTRREWSVAKYRSVSEFDSLLRQLTLLTGCAIIFPEYTLPPEKTFPTQQEECFAVVKYIAATGTAMHLRTDKFGIAGDSAGSSYRPFPVILTDH